MQLVLASTSPRRRDLLALLGLSSEICAPTFEERPIPGLSPREQVSHFAMEKARSVAVLRPEALVLGSDTVVEIAGRCLGKPADLEEARTMLVSLAGRAHEVHTAVALCHGGEQLELVELVSATVVMKPFGIHAIDEYLQTKESLGKAGAYSIQGTGGVLVERIQGDFTTVVGLPLRAVARLLGSVGYPLPQDVEALYRNKPYPNWSRFSG